MTADIGRTKEFIADGTGLGAVPDRHYCFIGGKLDNLILIGAKLGPVHLRFESTLRIACKGSDSFA